jgi:chromosome segregation ATPase
MKTLDVNYAAVAAVAESIEQQGQEPSVRAVRDQLGGGSNTTVTPLLRQWKEARAARIASNVQLNPGIVDLILAQLAETATQASNDANVRARDADEAFDRLSAELKVAEARLEEREAELSAARAQVQFHQGQLQERVLEMVELRTLSAERVSEAEQRAAAAVKEAEQRVISERTQSETLRQDLVRASMQLASVPGLEVSLEQAQKLVKSSINDVAEARQAAAVANERVEAQFDRACQAALRETKLETQLQRLQGQQEEALAADRALRQEILQLSKAAAALEARCVVQQAEIAQLRKAARNAEASDEAGPASPQTDPRSAA